MVQSYDIVYGISLIHFCFFSSFYSFQLLWMIKEWSFNMGDIIMKKAIILKSHWNHTYWSFSIYYLHLKVFCDSFSWQSVLFGKSFMGCVCDSSICNWYLTFYWRFGSFITPIMIEYSCWRKIWLECWRILLHDHFAYSLFVGLKMHTSLRFR